MKSHKGTRDHSLRPRHSGWLRSPGLAIALALLAITPGTGEAITLFGLVDTGELYSSGDGGVNWSVVSTLPVSDAVALAAGASTTELFLASRTGSFYRSVDAGASWAAISAIEIWPSSASGRSV